MNCKICGAEVEDDSEATNHVIDSHPELIDEELQEFRTEAEQEVVRQCFES